jgi:hypothetical protein
MLIVRRFLSTTALRMHAEREHAGVQGVLSFAVQARSLLAMRSSGFLTSISEANPRPFTSIMPYTFSDATPSPLIALNASEVHAANVKTYPAVSLQVFPLLPTHVSPSECGMWSLQLRGPLFECADRDKALATFAKKFPQAEAFMVEPQFFVFVPEHIQMVGRMLEAPIPIPAKQFYAAHIDEVARRSRVLIERLNAQHSDDLLRLCEKYGNLNAAAVEAAFCFFVDSLGFDVMAIKRNADVLGKYVVLRMPFDQPRKTVEETAEAIFNAFHNAKDD